MDTLIFTHEERRLVCVHEAAHAVVFALGGVHVYSLQVAPVGAADWVAVGRKGSLIEDAWGLCSTSDPPAQHCMLRSEDGGACVDRALLAESIELFRGRCGDRGVREFRRSVRAHICGILAGPIAEDLAYGEEPNLWPEDEMTAHADVAVAGAMSAMLPGWMRAYWRMVDETRRVLESPDVWERVQRVAGELERVGMIEYGPFLADALPPRRAGWPRARPSS